MPSGTEYWGKELATKILSVSGDLCVLLRHFEDNGARLYHPVMSFIPRLGLSVAACALASTVALAQRAADAPRALTAADYARAETFMTYNTTPLVLRTGVRASWLPGDPGDRFWYRVTTERGVEVVLVDPGKAAKAACDLPQCKAAEREDPSHAAGAAGRYAETSPDR